MADWKTNLEKEFHMAEAARAHGNEGRARVCTRRAAGIAIREYLLQRGMQATNPSAMELLKSLSHLPDLSPDIRQSAEYLTLRVTEEFRLPVSIDLVKEARTLCKCLLPEEFE